MSGHTYTHIYTHDYYNPPCACTQGVNYNDSRLTLVQLNSWLPCKHQTLLSLSKTANTEYNLQYTIQDVVNEYN